MANRRKRRKLNVRGISVLLLAFLAVCLALFFALLHSYFVYSIEKLSPPFIFASPTP